MIVIAGPPGSVKTRYFPLTAFGADSFNIDDRCAQILGSYRAIPREIRRAVAKECERFVLDHIEHGRSFAVETTLRTTAAIGQAELAHKAGFATQMRFVATDSIAENVTRVLQRAQAGGHGASEREIRAIHHASVANLRRRGREASCSARGDPAGWIAHQPACSKAGAMRACSSRVMPYFLATARHCRTAAATPSMIAVARAS